MSYVGASTIPSTNEQARNQIVADTAKRQAAMAESLSPENVLKGSIYALLIGAVWRATREMRKKR